MQNHSHHRKHNHDTIITIFGATGDLTARKLIPALYNLFRTDNLPPNFTIIGFARREWSDEYFREQMQQALQDHVPAGQQDARMIDDFLTHLHYNQGFFEQPEGYARLAKGLGFKDGTWETCSHRLYYLATPPKHYQEIINNLYDTDLAKPCEEDQGWNKLLIEKPFGRDLQTAEQLDKFLGERFQENQIFRIDHYLAKETVQNILTFRFSNSIFEPVWNNQFIESIHIRMLESRGVTGRGEFFDDVGALRDVGQNHVLQMLALTTMDNPEAFTAPRIRQKRHEILKTLQNIPEDQLATHTIRAQYAGFREETGVNPESQTETYFKITSYLDHPRWHGVPITLESGKGLAQDLTDIKVTFKHPTVCICPPQPGADYQNSLVFRIQPDEGINLAFWAKKPGLGLDLELKNLAFEYKSGFEGNLPDAYEKILLDAINGDQTLFTHTDELLDSWDFIQGIGRGWEQNRSPLLTYQPGSWGP